MAAVNRWWYPEKMMHQRVINPYSSSCVTPYVTAPYSTACLPYGDVTTIRTPGAVESCLTWKDRDHVTETSRSTKLTTTQTTLKTTEHQGEQRHKSTVTFNGPPDLCIDYINQRQLQQQQQQQQQQQPVANHRCMSTWNHRHPATRASSVPACSRLTGELEPAGGMAVEYWGRGDDVDEVRVIEAVHKASATPDVNLARRGATVTFGNQQLGRYNTMPRPPSRCRESVRRRPTAPSTRRWVQVHEDDQGRAVDMTIIRPNTPQQYCQVHPGNRCHCQTAGESGCMGGARHCNSGDYHKALPPTCPSSRRPVTAFNRSKSAPLQPCTCCCREVTTTCIPDVLVPASTMMTSSGYTRGNDVIRRHVTYEAPPTIMPATVADANDAAREALLAIYQAGKPDEMFHARAPSTAVLQSMLSAVTMDTNNRNMAANDMLRRFESSEPGAALVRRANSDMIQRQAAGYQNCRPPTSCVVGCCNGGADQHGNDARCLATSNASCCRPGNRMVAASEVISDVTNKSRPVNVNVECPANTDTVVSFRVQSKPTQRVFF